MWRDVSLTYRGALQILGHHDRPWLDRMDRLLGGGILAAGVTALAVAAPGPAAAFAAVWGWIDQKNEARSLLRAALDRVSGRLLGLEGYERHQLIVAAHTTVVVSAFFEALGEAAEGLSLQDEDRGMLLTSAGHREGEHLFEILYQSEVPIPSATCGFEENLGQVEKWLNLFAERTLRHLHILRERRVELPGAPFLAGRALERYRSRYLGLAASVPEFFIWASLGEHAATRQVVTGARTELREAFQSQGAALARIEQLLTLATTGRERTERDVAAVIARANRGALSEPVVPVTDQPHPALTVPTVAEIYVSPHCSFATYHRNVSHPASEPWWGNQRVSQHLDLLLAAHLTSPVAFQRPLLLLGHPGAGKSLLTQVLAARLPSASYTVVRVPLRRVNADAGILEQIQAALDLATNGRAQWWEVAQANRQAVRVVLLDGLDELLQAVSGGRDRRGYLQEIMDFQRAEAQQGFPVAVIVTSRTVVADRVLIADGTPIIKLKDFADWQIADWLKRWDRVNEAAIAAGRVRTLSLASVLERRELAEQPLLLLMLALYAADPAAPPIDEVMSTTALYRRLLTEFVRREAAKQPEGSVAEKKQLWRLTVAAFAMLNRGRQDITDTELGADLIALEDRPSEAADVAEIGRDLVGRFFFVHRAEARTGNEGSVRRCYEFLHATFGEYLVAAHIVESLRTLAAMRSLSGRPVDDGFLYALLSHQPLSDRRQVLAFAAELSFELTARDREQIRSLLEELAASVRRRHDTGRHASYRPVPLDRVRQLAAYSLNLVLLRVRVGPPLGVASLCGPEDDPQLAWRSTVRLWAAGLGPERLDGLMELFHYSNGFVREVLFRYGAPPQAHELDLARLAGDKMLERRLKFGVGVHDGYVVPDDSWDEATAASLVRALLWPGKRIDVNLREFYPGVPDEAAAAVARLADMLLILRSRHLVDGLSGLVNWRLGFGAAHPPNPAALVAALLADPDERLVEMLRSHLDADHPLIASLQEPGQMDMLREVVKLFRWPDDPVLPDSVHSHEWDEKRYWPHIP
ncbi:NACHT domain-containing protein [Nonomuraea typhae]|uniref:NACHT domain-containing protein n=1 Tax=Nonomuraea typhae TaxID=2603600 RepID=UPI0012FC50B3|nr:AAA family ATPase [Nonomuraea typhae]